MQQSNSVVRIERTSTHENAEHFINNKRKGDKRNKTKRGFSEKRLWSDLETGSRRMK